MEDQRSSFENLPIEMVSKIFELLPLKSKKKCRLVCQYWRWILDTNYFFDFTIFRSILKNSNVKYFFNSPIKMDSAKMVNLTKRMPWKEGRIEFPSIQNAIIGWKNSQANIVKFLKFGCTQVRTLAITKFSLEKIRKKALTETLSGNEWSYLKQLKLEVIIIRYKFERTVLHSENVNTMFRIAQFQTLHDFDFKFKQKYEKYFDGPYRFQKIWIGFYIFLANHSSLKNLTCDVTAFRNTIMAIVTERNVRPEYAFPEIPDHLKSSMSENLKLSSFIYKFKGVVNPQLLVSTNLISPNLKTLEVRHELDMLNVMTTIRQNMAESIQQVCETTGNTLHHLKLCLSEHDFHFNFLNSCPHLETLELNTWNCRITQQFNSASKVNRPKNLKRIKINVYDNDEEMIQIITKLIKGNEKTLQEVTLHIRGVIDLRWFLGCSLLEHMSLTTDESFRPVESDILNLQMNLKTLHIDYCSYTPHNPPFPSIVPEIIRQNSRTIREIKIHCQTSVHMNWFQSCSSLESLLIKIHRGGLGRILFPLEEGQINIYPMNLKNLKLINYTNTIDEEFILGAQELINEIGTPIKKLQIPALRNLLVEVPINVLNLSLCVTLKSLQVEFILTPNEVNLNVNAHFPNLTEFIVTSVGLEIKSVPDVIVNWIINSMPNVKEITLGHLAEPVLFLLGLLKLTKLTKFITSNRRRGSEVFKETRQFCNEIRGLKFRVVDDTDDRGRSREIGIVQIGLAARRRRHEKTD